MNGAIVLAAMAGVAVAVQVVANSVGMRDLGTGALIGLSGVTTGLAGFAVAFFLARPEFTGRAILCAVVSGILGSFILGSIVISAVRGGVAQTLSVVISSQLIAGLIVDRLGLLGSDFQAISVLKIFGVVLMIAGVILVVRY